MSKKKKNSVFMGVFDVLFIMILCFATLLTTMLMQGGVLVGGSGEGMKYHFSIATFLIVVAGLVIYLTYIIPHSNKELRQMIKHMYEDKK